MLDVVGLTPALLGEHTPPLKRLAERGRAVPLKTITPAVTTDTVEATAVHDLLQRHVFDE